MIKRGFAFLVLLLTISGPGLAGAEDVLTTPDQPALGIFTNKHSYLAGESGFSVDKRTSGWKVWQKLPERIETVIMCKGLWHNLMLLY